MWYYLYSDHLHNSGYSGISCEDTLSILKRSLQGLPFVTAQFKASPQDEGRRSLTVTSQAAGRVIMMPWRALSTHRSRVDPELRLFVWLFTYVWVSSWFFSFHQLSKNMHISRWFKINTASRCEQLGVRSGLGLVWSWAANLLGTSLPFYKLDS